MSDTILGGWSAWSFDISKEAQTVFAGALKGFVGVNYTPLAFATQVVAGMNYCFICKGKVVYPGAPNTAVKLYIYQPLEGNPHIVQILQITP